MSSKKIPLVRISDKAIIDSCQLFFERTLSYPGEEPCQLIFKNERLGYLNVNDIDIFGCLCKLRIILEKQGFFIACYGARVDSYSFGLSRNMGGGAKLYQLKMGKRETRKDLHWILEETYSQSLGTVDEQLKHYKNWLKSVYE